MISWLLSKTEQVAVGLWRRRAIQKRAFDQEARPFLLQLRRTPGVKPWVLALPDPLSMAPDRRIPRKDADEARRWLYGLGAADWGLTEFRLFVKADGPASITLHDLAVVVVQKNDPLEGSSVCNPDAGSHVATVLVVDLDEPKPELVPATYEEGQITALAEASSWGSSGRRVDLVPGEAHEFYIHAQTQRHLVEWYLRAEVTVGMQTSFYNIRDENGRNFLTSGSPLSGFRESWDWAWHLDPPRFAQVDDEGIPLPDQD